MATGLPRWREASKTMREAMYYVKREDERVQCRLCPKLCVIPEGRNGFCKVRRHERGKLLTLNYARVASYGMDPIEKKPLYNFYPGSYIFSMGTFGCNLACAFCQNWEISQKNAPTVEISPEAAVRIAVRQRGEPGGNVGIAYTYSEPFMWYEYVLDTARLAHEAGLKNVMVTNGSVTEEPLKEIIPHIDAMNIDVKAFTEKFYHHTCKGGLGPVQRTVEIAHDAGVHVELTNLVIPTLNDSAEEIGQLVDWVASIDSDIPLHFSRYFPNYKLEIDPTPTQTLQMAYAIARKKLHYVYVGNIAGGDGHDTICPACGTKVVERGGMGLRRNRLRDGHCPECGEAIKVVDEVLSART